MIPSSRIRAAALAVLLAIGLLAATRQVGPHELYAPHGAYRAQVDAMLDGRLALSKSPDALAHDLAWTPAGVQQVWGLGVPLWQLPFEEVGRLVGLQPFPDRVPLALFLALAAYVLLRGLRRSPDRPDESRASGPGALVIAFLLPGFVALVRSRMGVYEEAAIYAYAAGIGLLGGLLAFLRHPTGARYLLLLLAAGAVGLIRPTVWFYGAATAAIATVAWLRHARSGGLAALIAGVTLYLAGGAALYATNVERFGAGLEFGHRLNLESLPGNLVATRFSHPFERVGTLDAVAELGGALFDQPEQAHARGFYATGLHRGEHDDVPRWREYYFTTYAWPYAPILVAGLIVGALAWWRRDGRGGNTQHVLWTWAIIGAAPLVAFYLRSPSMSSRYQLDLAPAIAALLIVAWRAFANALATRWIATAVVLVAAWTAAVVTSRVHRPKLGGGATDRAAAVLATYAISRPVPYHHELPDAYDLDDPELATYTDVATSSARCTDELGALQPCDRPLAGDRVVDATRDGRWWDLATTTWIEAEDPGVCFVDDATCHAGLDLSRPIARATRGPTLYLNGTGWDLDTGELPPATYVYVRDPEFVDVDVVGPEPETTRVAIDGTHLVLAGGADLANGATRLHFVASPARSFSGLRVVFLAVGPDTALDRPRSGYVVRRIAWH